jgi:hypothetical protein
LGTIIHGIVPPTINHFTDDENIDSRLNFTFNEAAKKDVKVAMSNTFGFGGHNAFLRKSKSMNGVTSQKKEKTNGEIIFSVLNSAKCLELQVKFYRSFFF